MEHSTTHPRIPAITHPSIARPIVSKKSVFVAALSLFGIFNIAAGLISLLNWIILSSNTPSLASTMLTDATCGFALSALIFASARAFTRGKLLSVWLYGGSILLDSLYNLLTGYPLNYVFIVFGLLVIWQIFNFKSELELS